jgi:hypothetical protein
MGTDTVLLTLSADGNDSELFAARRADWVHAAANATVNLKKGKERETGVMFNLSVPRGGIPRKQKGNS